MQSLGDKSISHRYANRRETGPSGMSDPTLQAGSYSGHPETTDFRPEASGHLERRHGRLCCRGGNTCVLGQKPKDEGGMHAQVCTGIVHTLARVAIYNSAPARNTWPRKSRLGSKPSCLPGSINAAAERIHQSPSLHLKTSWQTLQTPASTRRQVGHGFLTLLLFHHTRRSLNPSGTHLRERAACDEDRNPQAARPDERRVLSTPRPGLPTQGHPRRRTLRVVRERWLPAPHMMFEHVLFSHRARLCRSDS